MANSASDGKVVAQRFPVLLLIAYVVHFAEEWYGEITLWANDALGYEVSIERLLLLNGIAFVLFAVGTVASIRSPRMAWFTVSFAALLGLNGILHTLATLGLGQYSPGTVTSLVLYIPLSINVLRSSAAQLPRTTFRRSIVGGVLFHGLVTIFAVA
jgi:hypothetical protein